MKLKQLCGIKPLSILLFTPVFFCCEIAKFCCPKNICKTLMLCYLAGDWSWGAIIWTSVGWSMSVGLGLLCCIYMATLHENDLWFSNIKVKGASLFYPFKLDKKPTNTNIWALSLIAMGIIGIHSYVKWLCSSHWCSFGPAPVNWKHNNWVSCWHINIFPFVLV